MVACGTVCLRRLGGGERADEVRFGRLLANPKVTLERLIAGWSDRTAPAAAGRHVLALQDTSEINFRTTPAHRRGLGEIGRGNAHGALLHAMLAVDAESGGCLGLVAGAIWTRNGRVSVPHEQRALPEKESRRWLATAAAAKTVLSAAASVTVIADRESDIYAEWATLPAQGFHLITRVMQDRALSGGGSLYAAAMALPSADRRCVALPARGPQRPARNAELTLRFVPVALRRPRRVACDLPMQVVLTLVEVVELQPPPGVEPIHWRLLTTHAVNAVAAAWRIVDWYAQRWIIEQLFRTLKTQGLKLEDSQLDSAASLLKLIAVATKAAATTLQLVQARDGRSAQPAHIAFGPIELDTLDALNVRFAAASRSLKNPHPNRTLAWAAWIIGRLGGWDGYPSSKPPGPITLKHGLDRFHAIVSGWTLRNVCMP